ncbi:MAG TPA: DUF4124 domain-containing protein [Burkholderiales bacterium]|nr:DUF4124 domain-containing protein [Burkholderiales bacterium]
MFRSTVHRSAGVFAASVLTFAVAAPVGAEVYKWTDAQGVVHYSNVAPRDVRSAERVPENRLSIVTLPKPSAEEVRALNERLQNRRINQLEEALRAARRSSDVAYAPAEGSGVYYPASGWIGGHAEPPLGEVIIDRDLDADGNSRRTNIRFIPRYVIKPGPGGIGGQAVAPPAPPKRAREVHRLP